MPTRMFLGTVRVPDKKRVRTVASRNQLVSLTGGDESIPANLEFTTWLAKTHAQMVAGKKNWPIFSERRMGQVLQALGIDTADQLKRVDEPLAMPSFFTRPEETVRLLRGLSFLTTDPSSAAEHLRVREALTRL
jgi:hypothetical protein